MDLQITPDLRLPEEEYEISAVRAQGAGGQNVNKLATAIHLRFDIPASSLPATCKQRLLARRDRRITRDGVLVIKAQAARTQERNRAQALERLRELIRSVLTPPKRRIPTKPSRSARQRRLEAKKRRGQDKALRRKLDV
ncbi:MAG TPA: alternative ribosome rescue aminoacyl-tRNA hydrolase ArfB [Thiohalobacter sp.]|nr:alternative ribosome rescue aminoacyl-tRNA hydrolase ArfB [Thiohalobacter sp.]